MKVMLRDCWRIASGLKGTLAEPPTGSFARVACVVKLCKQEEVCAASNCL